MLLVLLLPTAETAPTPVVVRPHGEETTDEGPLEMEIGDELESSIIIIACRRFVPAPMMKGVSGECECACVVDVVIVGKGSGRTEGFWMFC